MIFRSGIRLIFAAWLTFATVPASGLDIRGYTSARHDRFTNFPTAPVLNTGSWFNGSQYTGLGWLVSNPQRQFALVSPRHFVMATHYGVSPGDQISFLSSTGTVVTAIIDTTTAVTEGATGSDLTLGRFVDPIPEGSGVTPFPYLNLPSENAYRTTNLQVFGFDARAGRGIVSAFTTQGLSGSSRMYYFDYRTAGSGLQQDDCHFVVGDSGSPSFASANGTPALMGVHGALGTIGTTTINLDTFVPHYVTELNALMAPDGYQMIPAYSSANTLLGTSGATTPDPLRQAEAGTATFTVDNPGGLDAANPIVVVTFPSGSEPVSVTATGWTPDTAGPQVWTFQRASLLAGASSTFTASWTTLPVSSTLIAEVEHRSDASPVQTSLYDLEPAPSFTAWSLALGQPAAGADPDADGQKNLTEYAFGGNPTTGENHLAGGIIAGPVMIRGTTTAILRFPVRTDSQLRGLSYVVEYSDDLVTWGVNPPAGTTLAFSNYSPVITGFKRRQVTLPANADHKFVRVRTVLDETMPGMVVP